MFSGVVASLLTRYLSTYLKGVRADQLDISARGEVELRDVELKEEPLSELLCATGSELKGGRVGRVAAQLQGWGGIVVHIERLTVLLCAALPRRPQSAQQFEADRIAAKRAQLARTSYSRSTPSALSAFIGRLGHRILGSVEVHVTDLHIRYEDALSDPLAPFILGLRIGALSMESSASTCIAKMVMVRDASLYGGRVRDVLTGFASHATNEDLFARLDVSTHAFSPAALTPFFGPVDLDAQVEMRSATPTAQAELEISLTLPPLVVALHQHQLQCLVAAAWWARTAAIRLDLRRERPTERVKDHAMEWWTYVRFSLF